MKALFAVLIGIAASNPASAIPSEVPGTAIRLGGYLDVRPFDLDDRESGVVVVRDGRFPLVVVTTVLTGAGCFQGGADATVKVRIHLPKGLSLESGAVDTTFALGGRSTVVWTVRVRASRDRRYSVGSELALDYRNGDRERGRWMTTLDVVEGRKLSAASKQISFERAPQIRSDPK